MQLNEPPGQYPLYNFLAWDSYVRRIDRTLAKFDQVS